MKTKTFPNLKTHGITKRWQMMGEKWGEGKFGAKELPNSYVEDHLAGRHLLREPARPLLTRSSCFFSSFRLTKVLRKELLP